MALLVAAGCSLPDYEKVDAPAPGPAAGSCCAAGEGLGCNDTAVAACVCAVDDFCCQHGWDATCIAAVDDFGCGSCPAGSLEAALVDQPCEVECD